MYNTIILVRSVVKFLEQKLSLFRDGENLRDTSGRFSVQTLTRRSFQNNSVIGNFMKFCVLVLMQ